MKNNASSVDSLLTHALGTIRKLQVENNRNVLLRIIDVIKLIGKRGLSYRSKRFTHWMIVPWIIAIF